MTNQIWRWDDFLFMISALKYFISMCFWKTRFWLVNCWPIRFRGWGLPIRDLRLEKHNAHFWKCGFSLVMCPPIGLWGQYHQIQVHSIEKPIVLLFREKFDFDVFLTFRTYSQARSRELCFENFSTRKKVPLYDYPTLILLHKAYYDTTRALRAPNW